MGSVKKFLEEKLKLKVNKKKSKVERPQRLKFLGFSYRELEKMGVPAERAALGAIGTSQWRMAATPVVHEALSKAYLRNSGLRNIAERYRELRLA